VTVERKGVQRTELKLISLDDATKAMQSRLRVGAGDTEDAANASIVEGIIKGLQRICDEGGPSGAPKHIM
jgi:hypothetical protein